MFPTDEYYEDQVINIVCYSILILYVRFNVEFTTMSYTYSVIYVAQIILII